MRLRQFAADHGWPYWCRVLLARPGAYHVARRIWGWSRYDAFMEAIACLFDRTYRKGAAARYRHDSRWRRGQ